MARRTVRRSSSVVAVAGRRRDTLWLVVGVGATTMTISGGTITNSMNAAALAYRPFTVIRAIMDYSVRSDQAAALEEQTVAAGAAVVSDQAVAIGVTAVPTPITDRGSDLWFMHQTMFAEESSLTDRSKPHGVWHVDSRAMRRVDDDQDIVFVLEINTVTGSGAIVRSSGRLLIKRT